MIKEEIKSIVNEEFINQIPGYFGIISLDSKFLLTNNIGSKWTGFKSPDAMIGHTYGEMPCRASENHALFVQQDKAVQTRDRLKFLGYCCYANDDWKIVMGEKSLLRNKKKEVIGLMVHFNDFTHANIIDISRFLINSTNKFCEGNYKKQFCYVLEDDYQSNLFSRRQSECLFFLLRGKTAKEIAKILHLTPKTVQHYIEQIKFKLGGTTTKSDLIDKAIAAGYFNVLPSSLLSSIG